MRVRVTFCLAKGPRNLCKLPHWFCRVAASAVRFGVGVSEGLRAMMKKFVTNAKTLGKDNNYNYAYDYVNDHSYPAG